MAEASMVEKMMRVPEARYAYYRRCQVFRKGGEQCKAPAEKGSQICHAHAGQLATAVRRERERRAVLEEAVAQMRRQGRPECEMADLFMDFNGIQITVAVMALALIAGRVDCKTAGRLVVELQTFSKLLRMAYRKGREGRKENQILRQICAAERRLDKPEEAESRQEEQHLTTEVAPRENRACRRYRRKPRPYYRSKWTARVCKNRPRPEDAHRTLKIFRNSTAARAGPAALYSS